MRTADGPGRTGPRPAPGGADAIRHSAARWEDVLAVGLGLLVAVGLAVGWLTGVSAHGAVLERGAAEASERTEVPGVVTTRPAPLADMDTGQQAVGVAWTAPDGTERSGSTTLAGLYTVGDPVTLWTTADGELTRPPSTPADAATTGVAAAFMTLVGWTVLVVLAWRFGFRWTGRRFARAWELDWATVEPRWSGRRRA